MSRDKKLTFVISIYKRIPQLKRRKKDQIKNWFDGFINRSINGFALLNALIKFSPVI